MNEVSNFCDGECVRPKDPLQKHFSVKKIYHLKNKEKLEGEKEDPYKNLPYTPG